MDSQRLTVTILFADLRGFTHLAESLEPERLFALLDIHLGAMAELVARHRGTTVAFLGDAVLAVFGVPTEAADDALRAVACAVDMQRAVPGVNRASAARGLPAVAMSVGLHTGEVAAGTLGAPAWPSYTVVGAAVNLAARVVGSALGGEVLVSNRTLAEAGPTVRTLSSRAVELLGAPAPVLLHAVGGVGAPYDSALDTDEDPLRPLVLPLPVHVTAPSDKRLAGSTMCGALVALSFRDATLRCDTPLTARSTVVITLVDAEERPIGGALVATVIGPIAAPPDGSRRADAPTGWQLRFTSRPQSLATDRLAEALAASRR